MQSTGAKVSAIGHTVLIGWLILGWGLDSEPMDFEITPVSVVSGEEYAQMVAATTPQPSTDEPAAPAAPSVEEAPTPPEPEVAPTEPAAPPVAEQPVEETPPPAALEPPAPPAEVADTAPAEPTPPTEAAFPDLTVSPRPQPRPAPRIAPEPIAPPPPDAAVAEVVQEAVVPDEATAAEVVEPAVEETAPEETATEIAIADEVPSGAPKSSPRPPARPNRPAPAAETPAETPAPAPQTESQTATASSDNVNDAAVEAALADALAAASSPNVAAGPPMTGSEREGFRVAVNACWNVDPGSQAARVTMTVGFVLDQSGKVVGDVRQISAAGGDAGSTEIAFQAARRAILRCQSGGYQLPADKYDQWKEVEITFDPSGMRLR